MGVAGNGSILSFIPFDHDPGNRCRDILRLEGYHEYTGYLPGDTAEQLRLHFDSISEPRQQENSMDIKAVLSALETAGIKITTENVVPLIGQLTELGMAAAEKGISDLSKKAGVKDVTQD